MKFFTAIVDMIGINPFMFLPDDVLQYIFLKSGRDKGTIPVTLNIQDQFFNQTLLRYKGDWRLYINGLMLKAAGKSVGDEMLIGIDFDPIERLTEMHPKLAAALKKDKKAHAIFLRQTPSLQKEIKRYINQLKTAESVDRNVAKAILFLTTKERFIGREGLNGS